MNILYARENLKPGFSSKMFPNVVRPVSEG
jgi:hypothetical protein